MTLKTKNNKQFSRVGKISTKPYLKSKTKIYLDSDSFQDKLANKLKT